MPDPPGAVDLGVVQEEVGVAGGGEEVTACVGSVLAEFIFFWNCREELTRVATNPEVAAGVHAEVVVGEVALHSVLEAGDVSAVGDELVCVKEKRLLSVECSQFVNRLWQENTHR